jgi:type VI secretion system secreted protein Hcp
MSDPPEPNMPSDVRIFLSLTGARQGTIEGGVMEPGHEGTIEVLSYEHEIVSPRDAASGLPTGKRQHKPITLTIQIDKASPLLYNALVNNENISEWELQFWKPASDGTMQQFYTIELRNANIADIQKTRLVPPIDPEKLHEVEHVSFVYQKIIWTWVDGGITAEDDWESPVA